MYLLLQFQIKPQAVLSFFLTKTETVFFKQSKPLPEAVSSVRSIRKLVYFENNMAESDLPRLLKLNRFDNNALQWTNELYEKVNNNNQK